MAYPSSPYIEEREGSLFVGGRRVFLDSIVIHHREGKSPAEILQNFPTLKLWQIYGAIAYYLENEQLIDGYVAEGLRQFDEARARCWADPYMAALHARLEKARQEMLAKRT